MSQPGRGPMDGPLGPCQWQPHGLVLWARGQGCASAMGAQWGHGAGEPPVSASEGCGGMAPARGASPRPRAQPGDPHSSPCPACCTQKCPDTTPAASCSAWTLEEEGWSAAWPSWRLFLGWMDLDILQVFSNPNDSMILWFCWVRSAGSVAPTSILLG